jgi:hypothetical protein
MVVRTSAFGAPASWTLHLFLVQVLKLVRTSAWGHLFVDAETLGE